MAKNREDRRKVAEHIMIRDALEGRVTIDAAYVNQWNDWIDSGDPHGSGVKSGDVYNVERVAQLISMLRGVVRP